MDRSKVLADIRRRVVGSGEEHEILSDAIDRYTEAYNSGYSEAEDKMREQSRMDVAAVKFAHEICSQSWRLRDLIELKDGDDEYTISQAVEYLRQINKSPAMLRMLADVMQERNEADLKSAITPKP